VSPEDILDLLDLKLVARSGCKALPLNVLPPRAAPTFADFVEYSPWPVNPRSIFPGIFAVDRGRHARRSTISRRRTRTITKMDPRVKAAQQALAKTMRAKREEMGVSQEKFAALVGIDRTYCSKIERGIGNPSLEVMCLIARALNCSVSELIGHL